MGKENIKISRRELLLGLGAGIASTIIDVLDNDLWAQVYREGQKIAKEKAVFKVFPEQLTFKPGRRLLVVSRTYQTAAIYNEDGTLMKLRKGKDNIPFFMDAGPVFIQAGTGAWDTPTPLGINEIMEQYDEKHVASSGDAKGSPMPNASYIQEFTFNERGEKVYKDWRGIAVHGRITSTPEYIKAYMSHACIGVEKNVAKFLQTILSKRNPNANKEIHRSGDYVMVVEDHIPTKNTLKEVIGELQTIETHTQVLEKKPTRIITDPKNWDWKSYP